MAKKKVITVQKLFQHRLCLKSLITTETVTRQSLNIGSGLTIPEIKNRTYYKKLPDGTYIKFKVVKCLEYTSAYQKKN